MYEKELLKKNIKRPSPVNIAIKMDPKEYIVSKTDLQGFITYGNEYFIETSWYEKEELIGSPHNIIRHPDMPQAVFKLLWETLNSGKSIFAVVKNLAKDGKYYWVISEAEPIYDENGVIKEFIAYRQAASEKIVKKIEPLYRKLLKIEETSGVEESYNFLLKLLKEEKTTYPKFIDKIIGNNGVLKLFFKLMKSRTKSKLNKLI